MAAAIKPIRSAADHQVALERMAELMGAEPGTPEADELQVLADLIEHYEAKHFPIDKPEPVGEDGEAELTCVVGTLDEVLLSRVT